MNKTIKITIVEQNICHDFSDKEYFKKVNNRLMQLGAFYSGTKYNPEQMIFNTNGHANSEMFINSGIIQMLVKKVAYYRAGEGVSLGLQLYHKYSWKDVWKILEPITALAYNVE